MKKTFIADGGEQVYRRDGTLWKEIDADGTQKFYDLTGTKSVREEYHDGRLTINDLSGYSILDVCPERRRVKAFGNIVIEIEGQGTDYVQLVGVKNGTIYFARQTGPLGEFNGVPAEMGYFVVNADGTVSTYTSVDEIGVV
jgi:hypothetical protein